MAYANGSQLQSKLSYVGDALYIVRVRVRVRSGLKASGRAESGRAG